MLTKANVITLIEDRLHLTWELTQVEQLLLKKAHIYKTSTGDGVISFKNAVNILFNERDGEVVTSGINWNLFTQSLCYELTILGDIVLLFIAV
jgi:hypothetical protein